MRHYNKIITKQYPAELHIDNILYAIKQEFRKKPYYKRIDKITKEGTTVSVKQLLEDDITNINIPFDNNTIKELLNKYYKDMLPETNFKNNIINALFDENNNLKTFIDYKEIGVFTWTVFNIFIKENSTDNIINNFIGTIGQWIIIKGKISKLTNVSNKFGISTLVVLQTDNGEINFYSKLPFVDYLKLNDELKVRGKIFKHNNFKGKLSTSINYVKEIKK